MKIFKHGLLLVLLLMIFVFFMYSVQPYPPARVDSESVLSNMDEVDDGLSDHWNAASEITRTGSSKSVESVTTDGQYGDIARDFLSHSQTPPYSRKISPQQEDLIYPYKSFPVELKLGGKVVSLLLSSNTYFPGDIIQGEVSLSNSDVPKQAKAFIKSNNTILQSALLDLTSVSSEQGKAVDHQQYYAFKLPIHLESQPDFPRLDFSIEMGFQDASESAISSSFFYSLDQAAYIEKNQDCYVNESDLLFPLSVDALENGFYKISAVLNVEGRASAYLTETVQLTKGTNTVNLKAHISLLKQFASASDYSLSSFVVRRVSANPRIADRFGKVEASFIYDCSGFALDNYVDEQYQDPLDKQRYDFINSLSRQ